MQRTKKERKLKITNVNFILETKQFLGKKFMYTTLNFIA